MEEILNRYYENGAKKLHRVVDCILLKFGGIADKDYDDFYSIANEVFADALKRYDNTQSFDGFLYACLFHKIKTEITTRNRYKRLADRNAVSIDAPVGDEEDSVLADFLCSSFDIDTELEERGGVYQDEKVEKYLGRLSEIQRQIIEMKMAEIPVSEIKEKLGLTVKQYENHMKQIKAYENTKILFRDSKRERVWEREGEKTVEATVTTTSEKTKNTSYAISAISKKLKKHQLRDDHILQRSSGQWNNLYKSELISDILQGKALTQIIISEEIKNGITMYWLIDGKQRCTNIDDFLNDGFAVSKNVQSCHIPYQTSKKDKDGNDILNEDGFPIPENKVFDIRNKKFSQLPEELQDKFLEYQIPVMLNLNCTKKEIAYDIARFNRCKPMNIAQNGWTGLEEDFAEFVDNILKMNFFKEDSEISAYRESNNKSGMMRRMIVESITAIHYLDNFNKDFRKMCECLSEKANDSVFIEFYSLVERISVISNKNIADVFNIKDSFLWFALFDRFTRLGIEDDRFTDFIMSFKSNLRRKPVNGMTYDELNRKSTKDKSIIIKKLNHLEILMHLYFDMNKAENEEADVLEFLKENVNPAITAEDAEQYEEVLEELTLYVDNSSVLLDKRNRASLTALVAYSFQYDIDLDNWIIAFFKKNHTYLKNQQENYAYMKNDLSKFVVCT